MKTPLDTKTQALASCGITGLLLAGLVLVSGCDEASGPPGARPGMGPPGAPGPGASASALPIRKATSIPGVKANGPDSDKAARKPDVAPVGAVPGVSPLALPAVPGKAQASAGTDSGADVNPMAPLSRVEQAGNVVNLASEIIFAKANPFLDRLPKPIVEVPKEGEGTATPVKTDLPPDPFDSISLLGIAYHAHSPMALIAVSGGETQTQMVRAGDLLMMDGGQIKVVAIHQDSVDFQKVGTGGEKRTMSLPSVIGYASSGAKASAATTGETGEKAASPTSAAKKASGLGGMFDGAAPGSPSGSNAKPGLSNISKLSNGGSERGASNAKAPGMSLKEP